MGYDRPANDACSDGRRVSVQVQFALAVLTDLSG
jgi:hypothetical protein